MEKPGQSNYFSVNPAVLARDFKDAFAMFWAALRRKIPWPWRSTFWGLLFVLYFALPLDFVPEAVFLLLGFSDDLLFLVYVLNKMRPDIEVYRACALKHKAGGKR
ncbi:MAG: DUF1232 domain-containing protein [Elusimicrobiota bacterium]|jgi:uncharacterized membrane protein YkvA (DUF1232 family)|nr:DUF1232 domain-containing protein [Elusimicrobiota bacterium]